MLVLHSENFMCRAGLHASLGQGSGFYYTARRRRRIAVLLLDDELLLKTCWRSCSLRGAAATSALSSLVRALMRPLDAAERLRQGEARVRFIDACGETDEVRFDQFVRAALTLRELTLSPSRSVSRTRSSC